MSPVKHPVVREQQVALDKLSRLHPIFVRAAIGDFSQDVDIPDEEDEFMEIYVGVQVMLEVIREKIAVSEQITQKLEQRVWEKTALLNDLRKNKEQLEEARAKDVALLNSIGDGIIAADRQGQVIMINKAGRQMLQVQSRTVIGRPINDVLQLLDVKHQPIPIERRPLTAAIATGKKVTTNPAYYVRPNGTPLPVATTASPIIRNRQVVGAIIVFRDISRELMIDQAKSEFVSLASHQLLTPLTTIHWYVERMLTGKIGKFTFQQKKYLTEIYHGSKRMSELVKSLLNVSRIELGTFMVQPEPTDVVSLAQTVVAEFTPQVTRKKLRIRESYKVTSGPLMIDPKLITVILQNIVGNAVKYTPPHASIRIAISEQKVDDRGTLLISVTDTGFGIPKQQQGSVFKKLFRADNVRDRDTDGTGLGLYIVKSMVEHAGGKVWFESAENKGTTFSISLPLTSSPPSSKRG